MVDFRLLTNAEINDFISETIINEIDDKSTYTFKQNEFIVL